MHVVRIDLKLERRPRFARMHHVYLDLLISFHYSRFPVGETIYLFLLGFLLFQHACFPPGDIIQ